MKATRASSQARVVARQCSASGVSLSRMWTHQHHRSAQLGLAEPALGDAPAHSFLRAPFVHATWHRHKHACMRRSYLATAGWPCDLGLRAHAQQAHAQRCGQTARLTTHAEHKGQRRDPSSMCMTACVAGRRAQCCQ
eukprot:60811-Chlamydomonas_euryale.AAC.9